MTIGLGKGLDHATNNDLDESVPLLDPPNLDDDDAPSGRQIALLAAAVDRLKQEMQQMRGQMLRCQNQVKMLETRAARRSGA